MPYIDKTYFNSYSDMTIADGEFNVLANRAEDVINSLTRNLQGRLFDGLPTLIKERVKKATAAQVETLFLFGGTESTTGVDYSGVNIGKFSYTKGSSSELNGIPISPLISSYLWDTGLLYRGLC